MLRSPTSKTLVYTHGGSSVYCKSGDFTSHFSYKISLHRTLWDKNECSEENEQTDGKKRQVNDLRNNRNMREKAYPKNNQIALLYFH